MTKKIFQSIFTVALVVLLASIGLASGFLYDYFRDFQIRQLKSELLLAADAVNEKGATVSTIARTRSMLMIFFALLKNNPSKLKILNMK